MAGRRSLIAVLLLALGFAVGASWKSLLGQGAGGERAAEPRSVSPRGELTREERSVTELFEQTSPSVVHIKSIAVRRDFFSLNVMKIPRGLGSGFIWDSRGHVVTNYHVIQDADAAQVILSDQSSWNAALVGYAADKDLAVLRIEAPADRLKPIVLGSSDDLRVGQLVLAIGNPFGLDQTLTTGIISALGREIESVSGIPIRDVIQTDAAINPGNSGGPLLDSAGRLIGVNTAIVSPSGSYAGIGFAIPADTVNWVVPDLITFGTLQRPVLGVDLAPDHYTRRLGIEGALVLHVMRGSGAELAGMRPTGYDRRGRVVLGDIIVAVGGEPVRSSYDLRLALETHEVGEEVRVTVLRESSERELSVVLGQGR